MIVAMICIRGGMTSNHGSRNGSENYFRWTETEIIIARNRNLSLNIHSKEKIFKTKKGSWSLGNPAVMILP